MEFDETVAALRTELAACTRASSADDIPWNWVATAMARLLSEHGSGVSRTVLLSELEIQWYQLSMGEVLQIETLRTVAPFFNRSVKPPPATVFGLRIDGMQTISGTGIWLWRVSGAPEPLDAGGTKGSEGFRRKQSADMQVDAFVHQRYYPMIEANEFGGFFGRMRTLLATNLWMADRGGGAGGQPVHTLLPTTMLAFELRIRDDPNLPESLRAHTDEPLLHNVFGVRYAGGRFVRSGDPVFNADQLWCKVEFISEPATKWRNQQLVSYRFIEGVLEHEDPPAMVTINLWGEDVAIARLFKSGYYIGLLCPVVKPRTPGATVVAEYGDLTITFVTCSIRRQSEPAASQFSIAQNESGFLDYRRYAHRVQLCQCRKDMINLTLVARIVAVSDNLPYTDSDGTLDRYAVRIDDGSAVCDMTLWGELGRQAAGMLPGQLVLLFSLDTSEENGDVVLNGSVETGTQIYNISEMTSIPMSSALRSYSFLAALPPAANRYARVCIVAVEPVGEHIRDVRDRLAATALVHTACRRNVLRRDRPQFNGILEGPTDGFDFSCPSCSIDSLPNEDVTPVFAIRARIDDGTASLVVQVTPAAAADILRVSPSQLLELPDRREQQGVLTRPRGREVVVSITTFSESLSIEREVRIDAVCESGDVGMPSASI
ncbi:hypothetical protein H4R23_000799 [Coemansia sp. Cherry 401B]|nr:hypothetical protein H4R23_000799 [Coemansia sp. Cherry 401B]